MSKEAIEMIRKMDMEQVENQFVLQCAPLIAGLKMSNLFIIRKNHLRRLCALLQNSGIRCRVLYLDGDKLTVLLYNPAMLAIYMRNKRVTTILMENATSSLIWNPFCLNLDADIVVIVRKTNHSPMNWDSFWDIRSMTWKDL